MTTINKPNQTNDKNYKRPGAVKQFLADHDLVDIPPEDICRTQKQLEELYERRPDLRGDTSAIGLGDCGNCQSWRRNPRWHERI